MNCIFCKIVNDEMPSEKIYEDDKMIAILDIHPNNPGHTLVMPKEHVVGFSQASDDTLCDLMPVIKKVARAQEEGLNAAGFNVLVNDAPAAGQLIEHLHVHVIPRFPNDNLKHWPHTEYGEGEMKEVAKKLRDKI